MFVNEHANVLREKFLHKTELILTTAADMINQVLELGWNISLLPSLVVKNQTGTKHYQQLISTEQPS